MIIDELDLTANIVASNPSNLPLSHHVHHFITLDRASCCCESSESLLGVDSLFDEAVILLDNVIQILHRPMAAAAPDNPDFCSSEFLMGRFEQDRY